MNKNQYLGFKITNFYPCLQDMEVQRKEESLR